MGGWVNYEDKNSKSNQLENLKVRKSIFLLAVSLFIFLMVLSSVCALSATYSKLGNEFSSATGSYATSAHCISGDTCSWISGSQVILGVYSSGNFNGGSATWNFNVTQPVSQITSAELQLSWPSVYGKGLHSVGGNTTSTITVGSSTIASPATSAAISCGNSDRYAFACYDAVPTYSIPVSEISANTNVTISVPSSTLWDLGNVKLVINYSTPTVVCSTNAQCGTSDWVAGTNTCSNNNVYQNYKTFTCNNPGTTSSSCTNSTNLVLKETCQNGCTNGVCNGVQAACSINADCGIDGTVGMYPYYCSNNDRFAMYRTYTCNNPGTSSSSCTYNDGPKLIQDCGETHTDPWQTTCNAGIFIQTSQTTYNQGCVQEGGSAYCQFYTDNNVLPLIYCEKGCQNGACLNSACWLDSQCGTSGWVEGTTQCYLNNVYQNYKQSSCTNPGYANASCSNATELKLKETCAGGCSNGVCTANATGIKIENGKIKINGTEFLIKGVDYAPWLNLTGSDIVNHQEPFPQNRLMDVTAKVTSNGKVNVPDYSGDGKIQAWEVIKFDVLTMKKVGANTIRTYATAYWHDKDLDGVIDPPSTTNLNSNELKQGDLPDWAIEELLTQANANNMKVIMGYWVEEENFKETPFVANWDDLLVAKQALGVMMNKYKSNPAVLAWGIGNEVNGAFNQGWFSWGVPVNDYLNALFAHARTIDTTHPVIYAKYVGENANFNNLTADIISVNAFTFDVAGMKSNGEFSIPAPNGKAYMLGEFGHLIEQADQHWVESQKYAGGAFLEYNNVWWKGDGHNTFGIVDAFRAINSGRYNELNRLFGGSPVCSTNGECGTNTTGTNTCDGKNIVRINTIYACNNPGTQNSSCSTSQQTEVVETCANSCSNGSCTATCSANAQCGINDWIIGTNSCSNNDVYQNFKIYTCNNSGTANSTCSNATVFNLKTDCGLTTTSAWGANYCNGKNVEKSRTTYNKGCASGACTQSTTTETQLVQTCANTCTNGNCISACSRNSQCGVTTIGDTVCNGNKLYNLKRYFTCNNPGKTNSYCSFVDKSVYSKNCTYGCLNAVCLPKPVCSTNSNCGRDVTSKNFCENGKCITAQIACLNNSQCNDSNPQTTDTCVNAGTASSYCNFVPVTNTVFWTVTPSSYYELFNSATCNVATQTVCPGEMGWEGNTVTYKFTLPTTGVSFDNLILRYNIINLNYGNTPNVLLKVSVGRSTTSMSVVYPNFEINRGGIVDISIPISYFAKGTTNYIKVNGTNITPTGYGRNPPNFKISSVALVSGNPSQGSICSTNAQCNDNISNTVDTCVNPSASNSYCTNIVSAIACSSSAQCGVNAWLGQTTCNGNNIGDYFRTFSCINPGKVTSYCKITDVLKTKTTCKTGTLCQDGVCVKIPCSSNSQCNDNDAYTYDVCINPKKLNSECTHSQMVCLKNSDCDDSNPLTMDVCKYPKTIKSNCQYTPIACADNSACDDGNPLTVDKCVNPNKITSKCTHVGINYGVNSDCDDGNPSTSDVCVYPNTTRSVCKFYAPIAKTIWSRTPTSGGTYFGAATCNVLTGKTCPNEMGWEGNKVTYSFTLPQGQLTDELNLKFNVTFRNYGVSNNVLLRVSAGKSTTALKLINPSLEIDSLGEFNVLIPKSYFTQGATNYIQLYGTNISPIGTGHNPPNFKINSISLNQVQ